jgi:uncharacterized protein (TIGR00255 family)
MSIKSMTGFARAEGTLDAKVREVVGRHVTRGSLTISLASEWHDGGQEIRINERALAQVMVAAARVRTLTDAAPPRVDGLITIKGVLDVVERQEDAEQAAARGDIMLKSLDGAMVALVVARTAEGSRLAATLNAQLDEIERLVRIVEASPARTREAVEQRLKEQVARLMDATNGFDAARLHQEAVLLATRADVEEELQRLTSHISAARELIAENGAVGRKLDFLTQEFNREANTLCSKASDIEITRAGLALKTVIDQLREQVQNIE